MIELNNIEAWAFENYTMDVSIRYYDHCQHISVRLTNININPEDNRVLTFTYRGPFYGVCAWEEGAPEYEIKNFFKKSPTTIPQETIRDFMEWLVERWMVRYDPNKTTTHLPTIKAAIMSLDPEVNVHWIATGARKGKPRPMAVKLAYGTAGVTRRSIERAAPGYNRDRAYEAAMLSEVIPY